MPVTDGDKINVIQVRGAELDDTLGLGFDSDQDIEFDSIEDCEGSPCRTYVSTVPSNFVQHDKGGQVIEQR